MVPFTFTSTLNFPPIDGQPNVAVPFNITGQYKSREIHDLYFTGAGTLSVPMGTVASPGALLVLVEHVSISGAAPIIVKYNGSSTGGKELAPGGLDIYFNPAPASGITSIAFDYTALGRVRVWIFGG